MRISNQWRAVVLAVVVVAIGSSCQDGTARNGTPPPGESGPRAEIAGVAVGYEGDREIWLTSQGTDQLFILGGLDNLERIPLAPNTGPHITTFSPDGRYAYVSGMGNGDLVILHAEDRRIVTTLNLGNAGTHQAKRSPDGSMLFVAQIGSKSLIKVATDEAKESWQVVQSLSLAPLEAAPICTVFRDDSLRAYVSLLPSGIAVVDVPTMTLLGTLPTDGFVACGMIPFDDGRAVLVASSGMSGRGGHFYRLDMGTDALSDAGVVGAADWHSLNVSADGTVGFGSSPASDQLFLVDLTEPTARTLAALELDPTPGRGNDQPDAIAVRGDTVFVSLRASGKLAIVNPATRMVRYVNVSPPSALNPANCAGCAIHGVAARP